MSDWSSDVCSSDLAGIAGMPPAQAAPLREIEEISGAREVGVHTVEFLGHPDGRIEEGLALRRELAAALRRHRTEKIGRATCRERVCQYESIPSVAVSLTKNELQRKKI